MKPKVNRGTKRGSSKSWAQRMGDAAADFLLGKDGKGIAKYGKKKPKHKTVRPK